MKVQIFDDNQSTQIKIEDNGMGIDERHHQKVFELFGKINKKLGGAGIGLPLCKKIATNHGGVISIESAIGTGTIVTLSFKKN